MATIAEYTDVQVFSRLLAEDEIQEFFDCNDSEGFTG